MKPQLKRGLITLPLLSWSRHTAGTSKWLVTLSILWIMTLSLGCTQGSPYNCENMPEHLKNLPTTIHYMFVLWRSPDITMEDFEDTLFDEVQPMLIDQTASLRFQLVQPDINAMGVVKRTRPDGFLLSGIISMDLDSPSEAQEIAQQIGPYAAFVAAYEVDRAIPLDYDRDWPDGEISPGLQLVTRLERKIGLDDETFYARWFCGDTPYALEIHPFWRYERNAVAQALTEGAPPTDGIVALHARTDKDITNPILFLGGDLLNAIRVFSSIQSFINLQTIEAMPMREYILKSDYVPNP